MGVFDCKENFVHKKRNQVKYLTEKIFFQIEERVLTNCSNTTKMARYETKLGCERLGTCI